MKGLMILFVIVLLLFSSAVIISASSITSSTIENFSSIDDESSEDYLSAAAISNVNADEQNRLNKLKTAIIEKKVENYFCGKSTFGACQTDSDCVAGGCSNAVCQNKEEEEVTTCEYKNCYNSTLYQVNCLCRDNKCMWSKLTASQIANIIQVRNKLKFEDRTKIPCPTSCICTGSTMKCTLLNGKDMTIFAGNSGNVIVQVKGANMTTKVTLYKSPDGKVYGIFKNNETKIVKMLPDQVKERVRERVKAKLEDENITLNEDGTYKYEAKKRARLFFIFPVRVAVRAEINSETGEIINVRKSRWWAFLAKDETEEPVLGASCGTVTPGENDNCCKNKGYDFWNSESSQCEFLP